MTIYGYWHWTNGHSDMVKIDNCPYLPTHMESKETGSTGLIGISSIEEADLKIIRVLQKDARASYRDIARQLNIAVGTVQSRIRKLEQSGIIRGYSINLDHSRIGYSLTSLILLQVKGKHLRDVEAKLAHLHNVCLVYDITGDFDVAIVSKFPSSNAMDQFIKEVLSMDYVERTVTSMVLNRVKENYNITI